MRYVALGEICKIVNGSTPSRKIEQYWDGKIDWFTPKDLSKIENKYVIDAPEKITKKGYNSCSTTLVPSGSLLFTSRAPIGHLAINKKEVCTNQGFKTLVPSQNVDVEYLYYALKKYTPNLQDLGNGATFKELSKATISNFKIPLPPLPIQKKIAAILDAADAYRQKTKALIEKYDELTQSLFLDMFGNIVANDRNWNVYKVGNVTTSRLGKMLDKKKQTGKMLKPYIKNTNVKWFHFDLNDLPEMDYSKKDQFEFDLRYGDVLVCEGGEVGRAAIGKMNIQIAIFKRPYTE